MSTNEKVIMTVKLWDVDRLCIYALIIILNPIHSLFQLLVQNCLYFFIFETYPYYKYNKMFLFTSRYSVPYFDVLYVQIHNKIYK